VSTLQTIIGVIGALLVAALVVYLIRRQGPFFDVKDEFEEPEPPARGPSARDVEYDLRATELDDRLARNVITEAEHADARARLAARFDRNEPFD
jgi:hypothetical protein